MMDVWVVWKDSNDVVGVGKVKRSNVGNIVVIVCFGMSVDRLVGG